MVTGIQIPTSAEHAYYLGWEAFFAGLPYNANPYSENADEQEAIEADAWSDGWITAQTSENEWDDGVAIPDHIDSADDFIAWVHELNKTE